ncbi:MAG: hypothetical protein GX483_00520 [Actinomycetaceae bacterium]|nr:hypothetical protein [Actinomycetaceae bacterium]
MSKKKIVFGVLAATLILSGCSGTVEAGVSKEPEPSPTTTAPEPEPEPEPYPAIDIPEPVITMPAEPGDILTGVDVFDGQGDPAIDDPYGESYFNERGNLVKEMGHWGAYKDYETDLNYFSMRVIKVDTNFQCPIEDPLPPSSGNYVAIWVEFKGGDVELVGEEREASILPGNVKIYDSAGNLIDTGRSTFGCITVGNQLIGDLRAGETELGIVVYDTTVTTGSVRIGFPDLESAWEWPF